MVYLVLLLAALIALLVFLIVVLTDRFEEFGHHPQPTYYAALIQAGSAGGSALEPGMSFNHEPHFAHFIRQNTG